MADQNVVDGAVNAFLKERYLFERFLNAVVDSFRLQPDLNAYGSSVIHTIKSRLKDPGHLRAKIIRKWNDASPITEDNIFTKITDLAGVRVLHLYQDQFPLIHEHVMRQVNAGDWFFREAPVAYSWDPEARQFFEELGLEVKIRETYYTSIHYVVSPRLDSTVYCEIQVRTLFEEIWGEVDHTINYPEPTANRACKEQLRVLSKLVSTGTRLADSIFRVHKD